MTFVAGEYQGPGGSALPPAVNSILVPAGATYAQFSLLTTPDPAGSAVLPITLTAQDGPTTLTQTITLDSVVLSSLTFNPSPAASGSRPTGTVTLSAPAPAGGLAITWSVPSNGLINVPAFFTIPAGALSASFPVTTTPVLAAYSVSLTAISNDGVHPYQSITSSLSLLAADYPTTTLSSVGPAGTNGWYTGPVTVTLTASDPGASVTATHYSVDGGPQQTYSDPFVISDDASHAGLYYSINSLGNTEPARYISLKIDSTPPVSKVTRYGDIIYLNATDSLSGVLSISYNLDNSGVQRYLSAISLSAGKHSLSYSAVDYAGNKETPHTQTINVDTTFPTTTATQSAPTGKNGWSLNSVTVTLSATDPDGAADVAATYYSIDGAPQQNYSAPFVVTGNATHNVSFWSVDQAGNTETAHLVTVLIDGMAPTLAFGAPTPARNAAGWNNTPVDIPFSYGDNGGSGMASSPVSPLHIATEGNGQQFQVTLTDVAGNTAMFGSPIVNIDVTAPVTTASVKGPQVTLTATDKLSGVKAIYYTLDGGVTQAYSIPITVLGVGNHALVYWSGDVADNIEASHSLPLTISAPPSFPRVTQVRYWPRSGSGNRMVGGKFQGSLDGISYIDLATITKTPPNGQWSLLPITTAVAYPYLRYFAPAKSYGNIAELEFDSGPSAARVKIAGTPFGTPGSYQNSGNTFAKAFDGNPNTFFDAPAPGPGDFVGLVLSPSP